MGVYLYSEYIYNVDMCCVIFLFLLQYKVLEELGYSLVVYHAYRQVKQPDTC